MHGFFFLMKRKLYKKKSKPRVLSTCKSLLKSISLLNSTVAWGLNQLVQQSITAYFFLVFNNDSVRLQAIHRHSLHMSYFTLLTTTQHVLNVHFVFYITVGIAVCFLSKQRISQVIFCFRICDRSGFLANSSLYLWQNLRSTMASYLKVGV